MTLKKLSPYILSLWSTCFALPAFADNSSTSVPLSVVDIGHQEYKVGIMVSVAGGPPTLVTFDTGGAGLHIFASQVGNTQLTYTQQHIKSAFGSGLVYEGTIAYAPVTIGNISTPPIPILVIQKAYCAPGKPHCGANGTNPVSGQFYGEFGAGMNPELHDNNPQKTLYTPLRALPNNYGQGYIIQGLSPSGSGQLILGLTPQNSSGFNKTALPSNGTYPDGTTVYDDKGLMVNYTINGNTQSLRTAFDTGGSSIVHLYDNNQIQARLAAKRARGPASLLRPQQNFTASIPNVFTWSFSTGRQLGQNAVSIGPSKGNKGEYANTGISFYFAYDVLRDFAQGQMGFRAH